MRRDIFQKPAASGVCSFLGPPDRREQAARVISRIYAYSYLQAERKTLGLGRSLDLRRADDSRGPCPVVAVTHARGDNT